MLTSYSQVVAVTTATFTIAFIGLLGVAARRKSSSALEGSLNSDFVRKSLDQDVPTDGDGD